MGSVSSAAKSVVNVVEDVGSTLDDIVIQPTVDVVKGSIDLANNTVDTALKATESLAKGDVSDATQELSSGVKNAGDILSETYMNVRDPLEAAAVIGGNYLLPGSSLVTSQLVSDNAKDILSSSGGQTLNIAAGVGGVSQGNLSNWTGGTEATAPGVEVGGPNPAYSGTETSLGTMPEMTASETLDMIAKEQAASMTDAEIIAAIEADQAAAAAAAAATPAQVAAANAAGMSILDYAKAGLLVNALTGDPLGIGGSGSGGGGGTSGGTSGFAQVPIPAEWKSPTYNYTPVQNLTFEDLFPGVSLQGTQWQGLQNAKPNVTFNDIFAAGKQQTPMGIPVDINQIVSSIVGQATKS